jgi:hypothetical protein
VDVEPDPRLVTGFVRRQLRGGYLMGRKMRVKRGHVLSPSHDQ